jgi:hypothetical protein
MWINVNVFSEMYDYIPWLTKALQLDIHTHSINDRHVGRRPVLKLSDMKDGVPAFPAQKHGNLHKHCGRCKVPEVLSKITVKERRSKETIQV